MNITTPGGKQPPAGSVPTSVSRAAGIALTKALSKDYAGDKICVNTGLRRLDKERPRQKCLGASRQTRYPRRALRESRRIDPVGPHRRS